MAVKPPGLDVAVQLVITAPLFTGGLKLTTARALPPLALTAVGAPGTLGVKRAVVTVDCLIRMASQQLLPPMAVSVGTGAVIRTFPLPR